MSLDGMAEEYDTTVFSSIAVNVWHTGGGSEALLHLPSDDGTSDSARSNRKLNAG